MSNQLVREVASLRRRIRAYNYCAWLYNERLRASAHVCPDTCGWRGLPHEHVHDAARDKPYITGQ